MTPLEQCLNINFGVSGEELSTIVSLFNPEDVRKDDFYIKSGTDCDKLSFVQSGYLRLFAIVGYKDITQWIFAKGYFMGDIHSFTFNIFCRIRKWQQTNSTTIKPVLVTFCNRLVKTFKS